jgi:hypothetical protein
MAKALRALGYRATTNSNHPQPVFENRLARDFAVAVAEKPRPRLRCRCCGAAMVIVQTRIAPRPPRAGPIPSLAMMGAAAM